MIPGHYITGNESYNIPLHFPKDSEWYFNSETKIFNIFNLWLKILSKMLNFSANNGKSSKFWSQKWNFILNLSESEEGCYNFHFLWYSDQESWSRVQILVYIRKCFFMYLNICIFSIIHILQEMICCLKGQHLLTKLSDLKVHTLSFL